MTRADLHLHSTVSDGSYTVAELADLAAKEHLDLIAVTDHDTLAHQKYMNGDFPVEVLCGIEISACDYKHRKRAHILGYNIQDTEMVETFVHPLLLDRHETSMMQIELLQKEGLQIDLDDMKRADGQYLYKQHIMEYLTRTGQVPDYYGEFYKKTFQNGGICDFHIQCLSPYEAVETIVKAGGQAVLAHSGEQQNFELIPGLVEAGLTGLELNHPSNSEKDREIIRANAEKYHLFLTGGSDYHGKYDHKHSYIGKYLSHQSGIDAILAYKQEQERALSQMAQ